MTKLIFLGVIMFGAMTLKAQETFFPAKEGMILTYQTFDKKNKPLSEVKYTVKNVNINGSDMDITYQCESFDNKKNLIFKDEITIRQIGDILYLDMSNFINKAAFQQEGEIPDNIEVKGNNLQIPLYPQPGQNLPDANIEITMKMGLANMKLAADVTNRMVEGIEDVTVSGGIFNGYKVSCDINSTALGIKMKSKSIDWYVKGIGTVKTETYDKKGKLQSHTELMAISN